MTIANAWPAPGCRFVTRFRDRDYRRYGGWRLLDPIAAAIVGFMVARMGRTFDLVAVRNKSDRASDHPETETVE
jgi:hypothetical protein